MARVEHVFYKRCVSGDRRKVKAQSQKATTGGGARDIRLPANIFGEVIPKIFTETRSSLQGRQVNSAPVYWPEGEKTEGPVTVEVWSPTESRSKEMRLSRVHEVPAFDDDHLPPATLDSFFFIWKDEERVWARYVTVDQLRQPGWPPSLVTPILSSVDSVPRSRNIRGWRNLKTGEGEHRDSR